MLSFASAVKNKSRLANPTKKKGCSCVFLKYLNLDREKRETHLIWTKCISVNHTVFFFCFYETA